MVQSVPGELSLQETSVLTVASNQEQGSVTIALLMDQLKLVSCSVYGPWWGSNLKLLVDINGNVCVTFICSWNEFRANQAIEKIVGDGLAWVDEQGTEKSYWFPSLFPKRPWNASTFTYIHTYIPKFYMWFELIVINTLISIANNQNTRNDEKQTRSHFVLLANL